MRKGKKWRKKPQHKGLPGNVQFADEMESKELIRDREEWTQVGLTGNTRTSVLERETITWRKSR